MNLPDGMEKIPMLNFYLYAKLVLTIGMPGPTAQKDTKKSRVKRVNKKDYDKDYMRCHLARYLESDLGNEIAYRPYDYDLAHGTFNINENLYYDERRGYCEIGFLIDAMVNAHGFYHDKELP